MINPTHPSPPISKTGMSDNSNSKTSFEDAMGYGRMLLLLGIYCAIIVASHWTAYLIRFEFHPPAEQYPFFRRAISWLLPTEILCLLLFGQFRSLLSYFSLPDARKIGMAVGLSASIAFVVWFASKGQFAPPRSIIILSFFLDAIALGGVRLSFRVLRERQTGRGTGARRRIVIIGAGDVGANLAKEMKLRRDMRMNPIAFFDDDRSKWNTRIHGVAVLGRPEMLLEKKLHVDEAVIAMPGAPGKRVREVVQILNEVHMRFETVPSLEQLVNGSVKVSQVRPIQIEDLLGREQISIDPAKIRNLLNGRVLMVTGAGGSIGRELCRQIAEHGPMRILLVERSEVQMFECEQELIGLGFASIIVPLVADVLDGDQMRKIFTQYAPHVVFHAAAHKHVPLMEHQPYEAFRNNTIGTKMLAQLACEFNCDRFVLISSDKAINPTNVMGATKRLAELFLIAFQGAMRAQTKFMAVRFGNVLGSSGSVIPTFKKQIAAGGPVTVTHPDITRFFMTPGEAVSLVLQSATLGQGGEIFVLDMGKLVKIVDIARQLIELSGLKPESDIEIRFTGLRPGEKLYEELIHDSENMVPTDHPKILRFIAEPPSLAFINDGLENIYDSALVMSKDQIKKEIQKLVPEYSPQLLDSVQLELEKAPKPAHVHAM
jgi:FlaA1/EpsC-like NDP-sugar epimerase